MKQKTIYARLERLAKEKQVNKSSAAYKLIIEWLDDCDNDKVIRPCWTSGRGRFCKNLDYTNNVKCLLDSLGIRYVYDNDAPRGGLYGNFIEITTKFDERTQIKKQKEEAKRIAELARIKEIEERAKIIEESYKRAKDIDFSFVDADKWNNANSMGKRNIAHWASQQVKMQNNNGFYRALREFMDK